ncbi:unnamed protein product [Tenebrio molitor]|nr:unnamed protein product [Tenebrio molitor]
MKTVLVVAILLASRVLQDTEGVRCYVCNKLYPGPTYIVEADCRNHLCISYVLDDPDQLKDYARCPIEDDKVVTGKFCAPPEKAKKYCKNIKEKGGKCYTCGDNYCNLNDYEPLVFASKACKDSK